MRQKTRKTVITFASTADAMAMETSSDDNGFPGRIIPVPSEISAGCGLAWCVNDSDREALICALEQYGLAHEGIFSLEMY